MPLSTEKGPGEKVALVSAYGQQIGVGASQAITSAERLEAKQIVGHTVLVGVVHNRHGRGQYYRAVA